MIRNRLIAACISAAAAATIAASASAGQLAFEGEDWLLQSVGTLDASSLNADMQVTGSRISGSDGCNRVNMALVQNGGENAVRFSAGQMASTMMACNGLADDVSRAWRGALTNVRSYRMSGNELHFLDGSGKTVLIYARQHQAVTQYGWAITGLNIRGGVESSARIDPLRLTLDRGGIARLYTGCKTVSARYQRGAGGQFKFDEQALRRASGCKRRGNVAIVHSAAIGAALRTQTWSRTGDTLELRSADGALQIQAHEMRPELR